MRRFGEELEFGREGVNILESNIIVLTWGHYDATCEELMSETEYGPYCCNSGGCNECRRGTKRDGYCESRQAVNFWNQKGCVR